MIIRYLHNYSEIRWLLPTARGLEHLLCKMLLRSRFYGVSLTVMEAARLGPLNLSKVLVQEMFKKLLIRIRIRIINKILNSRGFHMDFAYKKM